MVWHKPVPSEVSKHLKAYRQGRGMTQKALADELKITRSFLCDIEQGRSMPSTRMATKIAGHVGITVSELLGDDPSVLHGCRHWYIQTNGAGIGKCADCGQQFVLAVER